MGGGFLCLCEVFGVELLSGNAELFKFGMDGLDFGGFLCGLVG